MSSHLIWTTASYGGATIASAPAGKMSTGGRFSNYFYKSNVRWDQLVPSTVKNANGSQGDVQYWDIVVPGSKTLKDAACEYLNPPIEWEGLRNKIFFRVYKIGDSGFGLHRTAEDDGVEMDESWFG